MNEILYTFLVCSSVFIILSLFILYNISNLRKQNRKNLQNKLIDES